MLEKQIVTGLITIMEDGRMQVREDTVVYEDGMEISRTYKRYILNPGDNIDGKSSKITSIANLLWTQEVIDAWKIVEEENKRKAGTMFPPPPMPDNPPAAQ